MTDVLEKFGKLVVDYCVSIKPKDEVIISSGIAGLEPIREVYKYVVMRGGYPRVIIRDEMLLEMFYKYGHPILLEHLSPIDEFIYEKIDAMINIGAPSHTKPLVSVNPEKIKKRSMATRKLTEIFMRRDAEGSLRWVVTAYPTLSAAQDAGFSPLEWREFVFQSMKLHKDDPVREWQQLSTLQERIAKNLEKIDEIRITGDKVNLFLKVGGRTWISDDGKNNMPGGEVFTGPIEDSVEGEITFTYPSIWGGVEVENVKLVFKKGVVVEAKASKGEEFLKKMLETDDGARRLGEFAFGMNYDITRFTKQILFDEKIGGTIHMALGSSYPRTGGKNQSSIHWDMIKDMKKGKVYGDGDLIYKEGRFVEEFIEK